jgi:hypothetical protein
VPKKAEAAAAEEAAEAEAAEAEAPSDDSSPSYGTATALRSRLDAVRKEKPA